MRTPNARTLLRPQTVREIRAVFLRLPAVEVLEPLRSARIGPRGPCRSSGLSQLCVTASAWAITRNGFTGLMILCFAVRELESSGSGEKSQEIVNFTVGYRTSMPPVGHRTSMPPHVSMGYPNSFCL